MATSTSLPGAKSYRGTSLEELLPKIREELGADALIVREREGVAGGIGGFFAKRCVEVEAVAGPVVGDRDAGETAPPVTATVPARVASRAYVTSWSPEIDEDELYGVPPAVEAPADVPFAEVLAQVAAHARTPLYPFRSFGTPSERDAVTALLDGAADDDEPASMHEAAFDQDAGDDADVRRDLRDAGFPERDADDLVRDALLHARPFAPRSSARAVVRERLAAALVTPLGWKARRRVVVLAGTEGAGTSDVAAALCAGYARAGLSVAALGLDGVRAAVSLASCTEDVAVAVAVAEDAEDVRRAMPRLGRPDLLIAVAPTVVPGDEARRLHTAQLLAALPAHELHLVVPAGATAADAHGAWAALTGAGRVKGLLPVALDEAQSLGGVLALALRERLSLRWTSSRAGVETALPHELATRALP